MQALRFCKVLENLGNFTKFAIFWGVHELPSLLECLWKLLLLLLVLLLQDGCLLHAFAHRAPEFASETAAALPSHFCPGEA